MHEQINKLSSELSPMRTNGLNTYNKGYNIVPVEPHDKRVIITGWSELERNEKQVEDWVKSHPFHSIGVLTRDTPFIDIDVVDVQIVNKLYSTLIKLFPIKFASRTGLWPKFAIPCINPEGFKPFNKQKSIVYRILSTPKNKGKDKGKLQAIEILANGQMIVIEGIHPDTNKPYVWDSLSSNTGLRVNNETPCIPDKEDLPTLTQHIIDTIFEEFEKLAQRKVEAGEWEVYESSTQQTMAPTYVDPETGLVVSQALAQSPAQIKNRTTPTVKYTKEYMTNVLDQIPVQSHDGWLRVGLGLHHQYEGSDEGKNLWKEYSKKYDKDYNEAEIDKRWPTFNKDATAPGVGIGTVLGMRNQAVAKKNDIKNNAEGVVFQKLDTTVKAPAGTPPNWYEGWYFISSINEYFKSETGERLKPEAFNTVFAGSMTVNGEKGTPAAHVARLNLIPTAYLVMYMPGCTRVGVFNNQSYINSYNEHVPDASLRANPSTKNEDGSINAGFYTPPTLLIDHIDRMIPDEYERSLIYDAMAFIVQNPDKRMHWAPVLLGIPGTGKTTIFEVMRSILGGQNVKSVSAKQFIGNFNNYAEGSMFNFIEEIYVAGNNRYQSMDNVKEMITNNIITVNRKGVNQYSAKNTASYFLATNRQDALPIDREDRRYTIIQTILATTAKEFKELYKYITDNACDIKEWLETYSISAEFDPYGKSPDTKSTLAMIQNTTDLMVDKINEALDSGSVFMNKEFISFARLKVVVSNSMDAMMDQSFTARLRTKLIYMNYTRSGDNVIRIGKERHTIFIPNINLHKELGMDHNSLSRNLEKVRNELDKKLLNSKSKVTPIKAG